MWRRKRSPPHGTNALPPHLLACPPIQQLAQPNPNHRRQHPSLIAKVNKHESSEKKTNLPCQAPGQFLTFSNSTSSNNHLAGRGKNGKIDRELVPGVSIKLTSQASRRAVAATELDITRAELDNTIRPRVFYAHVLILYLAVAASVTGDRVITRAHPRLCSVLPGMSASNTVTREQETLGIEPACL